MIILMFSLIMLIMLLLLLLLPLLLLLLKTAHKVSLTKFADLLSEEKLFLVSLTKFGKSRKRLHSGSSSSSRRMDIKPKPDTRSSKTSRTSRRRGSNRTLSLDKRLRTDRTVLARLEARAQTSRVENVLTREFAGVGSDGRTADDADGVLAIEFFLRNDGEEVVKVTEHEGVAVVGVDAGVERSVAARDWVDEVEGKGKVVHDPEEVEHTRGKVSSCRCKLQHQLVLGHHVLVVLWPSDLLDLEEIAHQMRHSQDQLQQILQFDV